MRDYRLSRLNSVIDTEIILTESAARMALRHPEDFHRAMEAQNRTSHLARLMWARDGEFPGEWPNDERSAS